MTRTMRPEIDADRLWADIEALAAITDPDRPYTRRSFSARFLEGRDWLIRAFEAEGLACRIDAAGNLIGRLEGTEAAAADPGVLMTGSHSDTVPDGGRFDGIGGVLAGLAAIRAMRAAGYTPRHTIELVDFLAEEPSEWGLSCVGSRGMAGALGEKELALTGPGGETLADAIDRIGGNVAELKSARRDDITGFVELHIEQGPVLEAEGIALGVVTGIAGISRVKLAFEGEAGHAGTTLMSMRADASMALARFQLRMRDAAVAAAAAGRGHFVATIGVVNILPGGANVVPGRTEAIIDIRAEDTALMNEQVELYRQFGEAAAEMEGCRLKSFERISNVAPAACAPGLRAAISQAAGERQVSTRDLASGAGHDTVFLSQVAPAAMIFVPSRKGQSHCPEEWTDPAQMAQGATCLLDTLLLADKA
ncbi:Zn-dependent hydrolase [Mangrovicoccus algicola]|uniref:Zn-dependent hydrolase n=1 Tax=Mangrovicoccus algicola TaxID=2771008 RepID=A0A8J7CJ39_9RHOB|nr:Zn-dependent hydrolase [Mangrovicoccus algicola]MBE3637246.1 Zn-dependent hydrolase [Mangrovicoccus algicola]